LGCKNSGFRIIPLTMFSYSFLHDSSECFSFAAAFTGFSSDAMFSDSTASGFRILCLTAFQTGLLIEASTSLAKFTKPSKPSNSTTLSWLKSQNATPSLYAINLSFTPATIRSAFCLISSSASSRGFASSTMTVPSLTE